MLFIIQEWVVYLRLVVLTEDSCFGIVLGACCVGALCRALIAMRATSKTRIREYSTGDMPLTSMRFNAGVRNVLCADDELAKLTFVGFITRVQVGWLVVSSIAREYLRCHVSL
jgi:hypothetical protein